MKSKRISLLLAVLVILALVAGACAAPAAPSSGSAPAPPIGSTELNLYGWSEYVPQALLDGFTAKTGIKVNYDAYSSNEELMAKLQAGASGYDVIIPSDYTVAIMIKQGLLDEIDLAAIPNFANVDDQLKDPYFDPGNKHSVPYQWGTVGLVYNSNHVTPMPTSWNALWDDAYAGKVVLLDDSREVLGVVLLTLGYDKNSTDPAQLDEAKAKLSALMPNVRLMDSDSPKTALLSGEVVIGLTWNGEAALAAQEDAAIAYTCPTEGCGIWYDNLAVPKNAPHKDAAEKFLDYVLDPAASLLITAEFPYSTPNKAALDLLKSTDAAAYETYMNSTATNPSAEMIAAAHPVLDLGEATTLWDRIWTEVKSGQ